MPKRPKLPEAELRVLIVKEARYRLGCEEFAPEFTLYRLAPPGYATPVPGLAPSIFGRSISNWDVRHVQNVETWKPECPQAFQEAVERARRKFDAAWPRWAD